MVASVPQIAKVSIFSLGGASYVEDIISISVVPTPGAVQKVVTLDGVTHQDVSPVSWALEIECVQDWDSARPGLAWYLWTNQGTSKAFIVKNETGTEAAATPKMTGSCTIVPIPYMGTGNEFATAKVTLPITGVLLLDATP